MKYKLASIDLKDIDTDDTGLKITTRSDLDDILPSIIDHGIINPPVLIEKNQRTYKVVCGFRRIAACTHLNIKNVAAIILDTATDSLETVKIAISDNAMQRSLNLLEESRSLVLLSEYIDDETQLIQVSRDLGLPGSLSLIKKTRRISSLPEIIQNATADGWISLSMAMELKNIEEEAAVYATLLFKSLKTGLNKQREIITNLSEIAKREEITIKDILDDDHFQEIVNDPDSDKAKKSNAVRNYLKERRFPEISKAENKFRRRLKALKLNNHMKLIPPKSFEGEYFELNFRFKGLADLKSQGEAVNRLTENPVMRDILLKQ
jgi:ParB family transcriptional regulator, chromosome partitioning protein